MKEWSAHPNRPKHSQKVKPEANMPKRNIKNMPIGSPIDAGIPITYKIKAITTPTIIPGRKASAARNAEMTKNQGDNWSKKLNIMIHLILIL